jgi:hypothetical protein
MNNETIQPNTDIKKNVLGKINSNEVKMIPKFRFTIRLIGLIFLVILTLVVSSLLVSYILFTLKISGQLFLLGFGLKGLQVFIFLFPWVFLFVDILLIFLLGWFLKQFSFIYHKPLLYLVFGTLFTIAIVGYVINLTSVHGNLLRMSQNRQLFVLHNMYGDLDDIKINDGVLRGIVTDINGDRFTVRQDDFDNDNDEKYEIIDLSGMSIINASELVSIGEDVFVAGDRVDGIIHAFGIEKIKRDY